MNSPFYLSHLYQLLGSWEKRTVLQVQVRTDCQRGFWFPSVIESEHFCRRKEGLRLHLSALGLVWHQKPVYLPTCHVPLHLALYLSYPPLSSPAVSDYLQAHIVTKAMTHGWWTVVLLALCSPSGSEVWVLVKCPDKQSLICCRPRQKLSPTSECRSWVCGKDHTASLSYIPRLTRRGTEPVFLLHDPQQWTLSCADLVALCSPPSSAES